MTPFDWQNLCKAVLSGGGYLTWKAADIEHANEQAVANAATGLPNAAWNIDMLMIASDFKGPLPKNKVGLLLGRSSTAIKGLIIHPGVIKSDYEGEVKIMVSSPRGVFAISPGDRIAQILLLPSHHASFSSRGLKRGNQGFGSTGIQI
jgi:dUTPase